MYSNEVKFVAGLINYHPHAPFNHSPPLLLDEKTDQ